jgi:capsular polysaccharide biosynthesis protein
LTGPEMHIAGNPLVVPTIPQIDSWIVDFLRTSFWSVCVIPLANSPKRIYISRAKARSRKIANEEALKPLLAEYGFSFCFLEDLSFDQQVVLFANAEVVCGVHGSGLTNVLFNRPGAKLIEIYHPQFPEILWWEFASLSGVDYYFLLGEGERVEVADLSMFDVLNHLDVVCEPAKLRDIFQLAGL